MNLPGLTRAQSAAAFEQVVEAVLADIVARCGLPLSKRPAHWQWLCYREFGIACRPAFATPPDWDTAALGAFEGRLCGDPHDPEGNCYIEYLATGTAVVQVRRIMHELAEYLILLRLPALFDNRQGFTVAYTGGDTESDLRHQAASRVERALAEIAFPHTFDRKRYMTVLGCLARGWHRDHPPPPPVEVADTAEWLVL